MAYNLKQVFFIAGNALRLVELHDDNDVDNHDNVLKSLNERPLSHHNAMSQSKNNNLYWVSPANSGQILVICICLRQFILAIS